jgi:hypothetical protein
MLYLHDAIPILPSESSSRRLNHCKILGFHTRQGARYPQIQRIMRAPYLAHNMGHQVVLKAAGAAMNALMGVRNHQPRMDLLVANILHLVGYYSLPIVPPKAQER